MLRELIYNWLTRRKKKVSFLFSHGTIDIKVIYKVSDEEAVEKHFQNLTQILEDNKCVKMGGYYYP